MLFMVVPWCYKHDFFLWLFSVLAYVIGSESHLSNCRHGREALEKERINEQLNQLRDIPVGKFQWILKSRTSIVFHFIILYQCSDNINISFLLFNIHESTIKYRIEIRFDNGFFKSYFGGKIYKRPRFRWKREINYLLTY